MSSNRTLTALDRRRLPGVRASKIGFNVQSLDSLEQLNVEQNVPVRASLVPGIRQPARTRVRDRLEAVGLFHRHDAYPGTLTGGEQQRVAIARSPVNEPRVVLADEPIDNLDSHLDQKIMMLWYDIARDDDRAVLTVTHDLRIEEMADRIVWREGGNLRGRETHPREWVECPTCAMRVDAWTATIKPERDGTVLVLCSQRCRDRFVIASAWPGSSRSFSRALMTVLRVRSRISARLSRQHLARPA